MLQEIFSIRVKELRTSKGVRQKDVADAIGITADAVCIIEKGKRLASMEILIKLADYFDVSLDYLVGRTDVREVSHGSNIAGQ